MCLLLVFGTWAGSALAEHGPEGPGLPERIINTAPEDMLREMRGRYAGRNVRVLLAEDEVSFSPEEQAAPGTLPQLSWIVIGWPDEAGGEELVYVDVWVSYLWKDVPVRAREDALRLRWDSRILCPETEPASCHVRCTGGKARGAEIFLDADLSAAFKEHEQMLLPLVLGKAGEVRREAAGYVKVCFEPAKTLRTFSVGKTISGDLGLELTYIQTGPDRSAVLERMSRGNGPRTQADIRSERLRLMAAGGALLVIVTALVLQRKRGKDPAFPELVKRKESPFSDKCTAWLRDHLEEEVRFSEMAETMGCSEEYMKKRFRAETGTGPAHALQEMRIERSKAYLTETEMTIEEISRILRFGSPSYYISVFSRSEGCSPGEYRKARSRER